MKKILSILLFTLVLTFGLATIATAQQPTPSDDEVNAIAKKLFCPVCENTPLDVCSTQACAQWRDLIRQKLSEGWTEEQIINYFIEQYGQRVSQEPPRQGMNWLVYLLPPVAFVIAAIFLFNTMNKASKKSAPAPSAPVPTIENDYIKKMEEELKKRKEND